MCGILKLNYRSMALLTVGTVMILLGLLQTFICARKGSNYATVWVGLVLWIVGYFLRDIGRLNPADSHTFRTLLSQYVLQTFLMYRARKALKKLVAATKNVATSQEKVLLRILKDAEKTAFGIDFGLQNIKNRESFRQNVPLSVYEDYSMYVNRLLHDQNACEAKLLTKETVEFFGMTSGTTGKNKLIPLTKRSKELAATIVGPLLIHNEITKTGFSLGRVLSIVYSYEKKYSDSGVPIGPISSYIGRAVPHAVTPAAVYKITDELMALHLHALFGLMDPSVERIDTFFSSLLYSFWKHIEIYWTIMCNEIESGELNVLFQRKPLEEFVGKDSAEKIELELKRRANPRRAEILREEFRKGFVGIAQRIWPDLKSVRSINAGGFLHYSRVLNEVYFAGDMNYIMGPHAATEGFFGINLPFLAYEQYIPLIQIGFFEFIPEEDMLKTDPQTYFADEVEPGGVYEMVYTSPVGLYRYRTGDIVEVNHMYNQCPVYSFVSKAGQSLNIHWEKMPEEVLYTAIHQTVRQMSRVELIDYTTTESTFIPQLNETGVKKYVFFLELTRNGREFLLTKAEKLMFDRKLRDHFELYETFRINNSVGPVHIIQVLPGTFAKLRSLAVSNVQYKLPRVTRREEDIKFLTSNVVQPRKPSVNAENIGVEEING